jgi:6-phosphogluconolactonase
MRANHIRLVLLLAVITLAAVPFKHAAKPVFIAYAGTYTKAIYAFKFDPSGPEVTPIGPVAELPNPSFLAIHPSNKFLYAVSETGGDGKSNGALFSYAINQSTGALRFLNSVPTRGGPCHLIVDAKGWMLTVANYGSGSIESFRIAGDGGIGESTGLMQPTGKSIDPKRQTQPHAHQVAISPDNFFMFVPDLGLDKILFFRFDAAKAVLWPNNPAFVDVKPGSGPRHLAFRHDEKFAYAINELSSNITAYRYDRLAGTLAPIQTISTLPENFHGENNAAEIEVDAASRFLYASNRGDDSIAVFSIDGKQGTLTFLQRAASQGKTPRSFSLDPTGRYLLAANQDSNSIALFEIDRKAGALTSTGKTIEIPSPVCIRFVPIN